MAETKGISVQVPVDLHARVKAEQEQLELTMSEYIRQVLEEHFTPKLNEKGGNDMSGNTRTLAFQVSEELFQRVKDYLSKHRNLTQKSFVVGLIEAELKRFEEEAAPALSEEELRRRSFNPLSDDDEDADEQGEDTQEDGEGGPEPQEDSEDGPEQEDSENGQTPQEDGETLQGSGESGWYPGADE